MKKKVCRWITCSIAAMILILTLLPATAAMADPGPRSSLSVTDPLDEFYLDMAREDMAYWQNHIFFEACGPIIPHLTLEEWAAWQKKYDGDRNNPKAFMLISAYLLEKYEAYLLEQEYYWCWPPHPSCEQLAQYLAARSFNEV